MLILVLCQPVFDATLVCCVWRGQGSILLAWHVTRGMVENASRCCWYVAGWANVDELCSRAWLAAASCKFVVFYMLPSLLQSPVLQECTSTTL
jgi:hypothetical protein